MTGGGNTYRLADWFCHWRDQQNSVDRFSNLRGHTGILRRYRNLGHHHQCIRHCSSARMLLQIMKISNIPTYIEIRIYLVYSIHLFQRNASTYFKCVKLMTIGNIELVCKLSRLKFWSDWYRNPCSLFWIIWANIASRK